MKVPMNDSWHKNLGFSIKKKTLFAFAERLRGTSLADIGRE